MICSGPDWLDGGGAGRDRDWITGDRVGKVGLLRNSWRQSNTVQHTGRWDDSHDKYIYIQVETYMGSLVIVTTNTSITKF